MKPIIGIVGRCDTIDNVSMIKVNDEVRNAVIIAGGIPLLILPTQNIEFSRINENYPNELAKEEKEDLIKILKLCNGIIMPGGYKAFSYDKLILNYAIKNNIPILGICLGMQIMGDYNSIELNDKNGINHNNKDAKYVHLVNIKKDTILNKIFDNQLFVNSRHSSHIINSDKYIISALSIDNLIEGIEYPFNTFNVGVEWHPESMISYDKKSLELFRAFINYAKETI